ncbi:MAG: amino acid adenylation domain-containing protein, partial [Myxococcota bacterium]
ERLPIDTGTALFDLSVNLGEIEEGLGVLVEYSTALWNDSRIEAIVGQFVRLLEDGMHRPDAPISSLKWLNDADERQAKAFAVQSLGVESELRLDEPVHRRVARIAQMRPEAPAVIAGDKEITYGELFMKARGLAVELKRRGVTSETVVAICLPRGLGSVLAPVAILEVGAAYVPIDPADPVRRRRHAIVDSGARIVVTDSAHAGDFESGELAGQVSIVDLSAFAFDSVDVTSLNNVPSVAHLEQLAYIIYTSGSTGTPKGVGTTHRGLARLIAWQSEAWPVGPGQRGTSLASLGFDASVWELWMTLGTGGTLVLPSDELRLDPPALADWLIREHINVVFAPTPIAERLLAEPRMKDAEALRVILSGGEKLTLRPGVDLPFTYVNAYGPAENSVVSTAGRVEPLGETLGTPPIGRPLPGVTAHILDDQMRPVPVGAPGELYIGGIGLARGYIERPGLTASRFVPDPFSSTPGARLYRTGDRVRFLADGQIAFLGRADHQIKVRGARVELGEIEAMLGQHPLVQEATVDVAGAGNRRVLVGFVVPDGSGDASDVARREEVHIGDWRRLYESTYSSERTEEDARDARFDIVGWASSYNGRSLPREEMREWVDEAVARIRALSPKRVLEIGTGTGLLLYRIAPHVERYVGVDFSKEAVERVLAEIKRPHDEISNVELHIATAESVGVVVDETVDTVVINSVAQYFPSIEYLEKVVVAAMARVERGGRIFLGDLRYAELGRPFYALVALGGAPDDEPAPSLAIRAQEAEAREGELLISPMLFHALSARYSRIKGICVRPKRFAASNELAQFRYDVVLELDEAHGINAPRRISFGELEGFEALRQYLIDERPSSLVIHSIPNARTAAASAVARELFGTLPSDEDPEPAALLLARARQAEFNAVDPYRLWALGDELGIEVDVRIGVASSEGTVDLHVGSTSSMPLETETRPLSTYGRGASNATATSSLNLALRTYLDERLPSYMVPERFVSLPSMPLTNRGKVDRRRLRALDPGRKHEEARYVAPRSELEAKVAEVFGSVLSTERVGAQDDFFELGGHSLLATRVIA